MRKRYIILAALLLVAAAALWTRAAESIRTAEPAAAPSKTDAPSVPEMPPDGTEAPSVLAARERALEGMTEEQVQRLKEAVMAANLDWEHRYLDSNIFGRLEDPDDLEWNRFEQTGEIQIGWTWTASWAVI